MHRDRSAHSEVTSTILFRLFHIFVYLLVFGLYINLSLDVKKSAQDKLFKKVTIWYLGRIIIALQEAVENQLAQRYLVRRLWKFAFC
jgi:hypothetical protein